MPQKRDNTLKELFIIDKIIMKKIVTITLLLCSTVYWFSCESPFKTDPNIYGQWHKVSWVIDQSGEEMKGEMAFSFDEDGTYQVKFGNQEEKGVFQIKEDKLYTTAEGQAEKFVKIIQLTADSLQLKMNRAGRMETVVLVK